MIIKKYANRKLYNTESHGYINLTALLKMVHAGVPVVVISNETKADITKETVLSALAEHASNVTLENVINLVRSGG